MAIDLEELEVAVSTVTLPAAGGPNKLEPDPGVKQAGWDYKQKPKVEHFNWLFYKLYEAIVDLDSRTVVAGQLPVGSVYTNRGDSRNPSVILGYGTWNPIVGTALVGVGTYTDSRGEQRTFVPGESGGEYNHILTVSEMPSHRHSYTQAASDNGTGYPDGGSGGGSTISNRIHPTGGNQPHNNMMPYTTAYMWERVL